MSEFFSFAHILENRLREEIRKEFQRENPTPPKKNSEKKANFSSEISWEPPPISLEPIKLFCESKATEYHKYRKPPPPPKPHPLNQEQTSAKATFEKLGLSLSAAFTQKELKAAYRRLSKQHHPDKGGDPLKFKCLKQSYDCLVKLFGRLGT